MGLPGGRSCLAAAGRASDGLEIQSGEELPPSPKDRELPDWGREPGTGMPVAGSKLSLGRECSGGRCLLGMGPSAACVPQLTILQPSVSTTRPPGLSLDTCLVPSCSPRGASGVPTGCCDLQGVPSQAGQPRCQPPAHLQHRQLVRLS